jgi:NTP pyrophosphatase (non-canonical NTP hydrolase)
MEDTKKLESLSYHPEFSKEAEQEQAREEQTLLVWYRDKVLATESNTFYTINPRVLHSAMGIANESGELMEHVKARIAYGKFMNVTDLLEEYGDLLWYIMIGLDAIGHSLEDAIEANVKKLHKVRYKGGKFTQEDALHRDKDAELKAMAGEE